MSSRNYDFGTFSWNGESEFSQHGRNGEIFQIGLFEDGRICAVHFRATDNRSVEWTTDYILDTCDNILAFQLYRDASSDTEYIHPAFDLPFLIRKVITGNYCREDNGLMVSDKPFLLHDEEVEVAKDIILRNKKYELPIVYLSCETDGHCIVNPWRIAEKLNGVAHVIFETCRSASFALKEATNGNNPYGGAIEIFYPKGSRRFLPHQLYGTNSQKVHMVTDAVFSHLVQLRVDDRYSWSQLQSIKLRDQLKKTISKKEADSKEYAIFERTYEELLAEKEAQIKKLSDQLYSANLSITQLESQLSAVEELPALVVGEECDLYPNEQRALLVEILERELSNVAQNSRRSHIIASLLSANKGEAVIEKKRKRIKACLHGYTRMTSSIRQELEALGFSLSEDGKHIKLVFGEDNRYTGTLSKTSSDHRAGDNTAHDLIRDIF